MLKVKLPVTGAPLVLIKVRNCALKAICSSSMPVGNVLRLLPSVSAPSLSRLLEFLLILSFTRRAGKLLGNSAKDIQGGVVF